MTGNYYYAVHTSYRRHNNKLRVHLKRPYHIQAVNMDNTIDLCRRYADFAHMILALTSIRPHPGMLIKPGDHPTEDPSGESRREKMATYDTRGLDIMIVLLRLLMSFAYAMDVNRGRTTNAEDAFFQVAQKDLGWDQEKDWELKRYLTEQLEKNEKNLTEKKWKFSELLTHTMLQGLFHDNRQFRLVGQHTITFRQGPLGQHDLLQIHHENTFDSQMLKNKNELKFDGSKPLSESVSRHFDPHDRQFTAERPKFLRIKYSVASHGQPISQLRVLRFRLPCISISYRDGVKKIDKGVGEHTYILCAVVRITEEEQERIRVYDKNMKEQLPAEVGLYRMKEPEAMEAPWSITQRGLYMLFYYRDETPDADTLVQEKNLEAPEYLQRQWAARDMGQDNR